MNNRVLEVILMLRDELSKKMDTASGSIKKFGNEIGAAGRFLRTTGREISMVGTSMAMFGTAITAPLLLAYKTAGDYSFAVHKSTLDMQNAFTSLSVSIGTALAPIMQNFANIIQQLVDRWNALTPQIRDHIVQVTFMAGLYLLIGGIALSVFGKIITIIGNLALIIKQLLIPAIKSIFDWLKMLGAGFSAHPLVWILTIIGLIITAMWQWKAVADAVCDTLTLIGKAATIAAFAMIGNWKMATVAAQDFAKTLKDIQGGKHTDLANGFDKIKQTTGEWVSKIGDAGDGLGQLLDLTKGLDANYEKADQTVGTFWDGFRIAIYDNINLLKFWVDMGRQAAVDFTNSLQSSFKGFFVDAFHGQLKTAQDYFAEFGNKILDIFADMIAKMITMWIESMIFKAFLNIGTGGAGGGAYDIAQFSDWMPFHSGGRIRRAHSGMLASDEVPIIAQSGEGIISRKGMNALGQNNFDALNRGEKVSGGGQPSIVIYQTIQAWDSRDVYRNRKAIANGLIEELRHTSPFRDAIIANT